MFNFRRKDELHEILANVQLKDDGTETNSKRQEFISDCLEVHRRIRQGEMRTGFFIVLSLPVVAALLFLLMKVSDLLARNNGKHLSNSNLIEYKDDEKSSK